MQAISENTEKLLEFAQKIAKLAGEYVVGQSKLINKLVINQKKTHDFVTEVDVRSEQMITQAIRSAFPDHGILAEEGCTVSHEADWQWIIDPLDGTTNFIHGIPHFAVSIAVAWRGELEVGVVFDPCKNELFSAVRGKGAWLNGQGIRVSTAASLPEALVATGFPWPDAAYADEYFRIFYQVWKQCQNTRRPGAASLDLAYVAAGRLDAFWEFGLCPWDMAAGALLVREAGGVVTDHEGKPNFLGNGRIISAPVGVHQAMLAIACQPSNNVNNVR